LCYFIALLIILYVSCLINGLFTVSLLDSGTIEETVRALAKNEKKILYFTEQLEGAIQLLNETLREGFTKGSSQYADVCEVIHDTKTNLFSEHRMHKILTETLQILQSGSESGGNPSIVSMLGKRKFG